MDDRGSKGPRFIVTVINPESPFLFAKEKLTILYFVLFQGPKKKELSPFSWSDHVSRLSEVEFKERYRLTPPAFKDLAIALRPRLEALNKQKAKNSKGILNYIFFMFLPKTIILL